MNSPAKSEEGSAAEVHADGSGPVWQMRCVGAAFGRRVCGLALNGTTHLVITTPATVNLPSGTIFTVLTYTGALSSGTCNTPTPGVTTIASTAPSISLPVSGPYSSGYLFTKNNSTGASSIVATVSPGGVAGGGVALYNSTNGVVNEPVRWTTNEARPSTLGDVNHNRFPFVQPKTAFWLVQPGDPAREAFVGRGILASEPKGQPFESSSGP